MTFQDEYDQMMMMMMTIKHIYTHKVSVLLEIYLEKLSNPSILDSDISKWIIFSTQMSNFTIFDNYLTNIHLLTSSANSQLQVNQNSAPLLEI